MMLRLCCSSGGGKYPKVASILSGVDGDPRGPVSFPLEHILSTGQPLESSLNSPFGSELIQLLLTCFFLVTTTALHFHV